MMDHGYIPMKVSRVDQLAFKDCLYTPAVGAWAKMREVAFSKWLWCYGISCSHHRIQCGETATKVITSNRNPCARGVYKQLCLSFPKVSLGNAALQGRLLFLLGLASSLEISRWPHPVRLSLQQEHIGNFRKPCTTSEKDKHWSEENNSDWAVHVRRSAFCDTKVRKEQNAWPVF